MVLRDLRLELEFPNIIILRRFPFASISLKLWHLRGFHSRYIPNPGELTFLFPEIDNFPRLLLLTLTPTRSVSLEFTKLNQCHNENSVHSVTLELFESIPSTNSNYSPNSIIRDFPFSCLVRSSSVSPVSSYSASGCPFFIFVTAASQL